MSAALLNEAQSAAVAHDDGPAAVYAGPGSGKTRVVALRAVRLAASGARLLVTTFTNDATQEMKERIVPAMQKGQESAVHVTTVHALCLRLLRERQETFQLLTDEMQQRGLAENARAAELEGGVSGFLQRVSFLKNSGMTAARYKHDDSYEDREFSGAWREYEKLKSKKGLLEFDDLVLTALAALEEDDAFRTAAAGRYTHILVDECQDMNSPQYGVVFALGREHRRVMLVGDPDQSLYAFRGADTSTFTRFAAMPQTQVYELRHNYRSTSGIIDFADALIRQDTTRKPITSLPTLGPGEPVHWERYADADEEAIAVGEQILRHSAAGGAFRESAVLYRTNAQSEALERCFAALAIPFSIRDEGDFYARREVRGLLAYLRFFSPGEGTGTEPAFANEWLAALLNTPFRGFPRGTASDLANHASLKGGRIWDVLPEYRASDLKTHRALRVLTGELQQIRARIANISNAGEAVRAIRSATKFDAWLQRDNTEDERLHNVEQMQAAAAHYPTIAAYLEAVERVRSESERRKADRARKRRQRDEVTLGTGHSAKGLEWHSVYAVGWSETILPHRKAEDVDEERRIAYVIATRAKRRLLVSTLDSWSGANVAPSRFLNGLPLHASGAPMETGDHHEAEPVSDVFLGGLFH